MDPEHDRDRDREKRDRGIEREPPVRRDDAEAVPEFERGSDLDRGQDEQEQQSER